MAPPDGRDLSITPGNGGRERLLGIPGYPRATARAAGSSDVRGLLNSEVSVCARRAAIWT